MKYSDIKLIKEFCINELLSQPDWREVVSNIDDNVADFEVDGVRFINEDDIDDILVDELASDEYLLGCFNVWAISEATGWEHELIEACQKAEEYEALGRAMTQGHIEKLAEIYISADGYGHHFNHYDGSEEHVAGYYVFDNRG